MEFKLDLGTGYMYCYNPGHPCANGAGKVIEHVYVMYEYLGRLPSKNECIHHIDRDKTNNKLNNLQLLTLQEHAKIHALEDRGVSSIDIFCEHCGVKFTTLPSENKKYCSRVCASSASRKFNVSSEELLELVWAMPITKIAIIFRVSDSAIIKRCKSLNIIKPPRGYFLIKDEVKKSLIKREYLSN